VKVIESGPLKLTLAEDYTVKLLIYQGRQSIIYK